MTTHWAVTGIKKLLSVMAQQTTILTPAIAVSIQTNNTPVNTLLPVPIVTSLKLVSRWH